MDLRSSAGSASKNESTEVVMPFIHKHEEQQKLERQDELLGQLNVSMSTLKRQASSIGTELDEQKLMIIDLSDQVDNETERVVVTTKRITRFSDMIKGNSYTIVICGLLATVVILIIIYFFH